MFSLVTLKERCHIVGQKTVAILCLMEIRSAYHNLEASIINVMHLWNADQNRFVHLPATSRDSLKVYHESVWFIRFTKLTDAAKDYSVDLLNNETQGYRQDIVLGVYISRELHVALQLTRGYFNKG